MKYIFSRLAPFFVFFVLIELIIRTVLAIAAWPDIGSMGHKIPVAFMTGFGFDALTFPYIAIPLALCALAVPLKFQGTRADRLLSAALFFLFTFIMMFCATGEWFFWDEFQSRYNFIAVDYLVYTNEVIGNIRESYPVNTLVSLMAIVALGFAAVYYKRVTPRLTAGTPFLKRLSGVIGIIALAAISFGVVQGRYAEISTNRTLNEVARNGVFELFSAYRNNTLDYANFYATRPAADVENFLREKIGTKNDPASPLTHDVTGYKSPKKYNLVLITVESLSADFLKTFGNDKNITPHLDALIDKSLFFSNLYATGTRTVYGLSAITLGIPPVPGNSIVRRPNNGDMFSLGSVLRDQGYETKFIYGGFGYFDNMNAFFANNGYGIVDRNNLSKEEITFANVWGVADDDLYRRAMKENDQSHAAGKPFFDMIMTTSNHRPFTYPDGKIDIPSHSGRSGGVKYTDYTINEFLSEAEKRPWFKDTIFVIVADHTASSSGKSELDPNKYHIPMWVYAPGIIKPGKVDWMSSQIDVPPTILGLLGINYESRFYGVDLLRTKPERAFISNYQQLGYMTKEGLVILKPISQTSFYSRSGKEFKLEKSVPPQMLDEAIYYYQGASHWETWSKKQAK